MKKMVVLTAILLILTSLLALPVTAATPPEPTYDVADVDGSYAEWDLTNDYFGDLCEAGDCDNKPKFAKLYLRHDCTTGTMYVLVLTNPGIKARVESDFAFVKINGSKVVDNNSGDDGFPPDFAWVNRDDTTSPPTADGWEASFSITDGTYQLNVHTQVNDQDGTAQTAAVDDRNIPLTIDCDPTAVTLESFAAQPIAGSVNLAWETSTEIDTAGFNVYRATSEAGPYARINEQLILAQGDAVGGAGYTYLDAPGYGTFYYRLEDVTLSGTGGMRDPVAVTLASPFRLPLSRPTIPR
jgi:hypothetical protein